MKIALIGYGKMGREVEQIALSKGHSIVARCDPALSQAGAVLVESGNVEAADVCIEFTSPPAVLENIRKIAQLKKPLVIGTTGWYEHLAEAQTLVAANGSGLVYAPNFSLGVNLFYRLVETAAELFNHFEDYDVFGSEIHHRQKVDSPSGTARKLSEIVLEKFTQKKSVISEPLNRADSTRRISSRFGTVRTFPRNSLANLRFGGRYHRTHSYRAFSQWLCPGSFIGGPMDPAPAGFLLVRTGVERRVVFGRKVR